MHADLRRPQNLESDKPVVTFDKAGPTPEALGELLFVTWGDGNTV